MHFLGMSGMPRRIPDFPDAYYSLNIIINFGSMITLVSVIIFLELIFKLLKDLKIEKSY